MKLVFVTIKKYGALLRLSLQRAFLLSKNFSRLESKIKNIRRRKKIEAEKIKIWNREKE